MKPEAKKSINIDASVVKQMQLVKAHGRTWGERGDSPRVSS